MSKKLLVFGVVSLFFCTLPSLLFAQNETAILSGRVVDPMGLAVPGSAIRLIRQLTGIARETVSDATGNYRFDLLEPGEYSIHVTATGFGAYEATAIHLQVALASQLDVHLTLGQAQQEVSVVADVSPVNAETVAQGTVISEEKIKALPLNGRQFLQLALLSPDVNSGGISVQQNVLRQGETAALSVAGSRTNDSAYLLDGVINTDPDYNALSYVPSVDAIAEFQVQVAQYSAEYGRASGGQINVQTQSGGNQWHGSVWNFLRNNVFDSRPFNLTTQSNVPKFQRNQFGGTIGGPLAKNRLFAFFNYEGLRNRQAAANLTTIAVPDQAERNGNFSEELATTVIYNPSNPIVNGLRTPFSGNIIPSNLINTQVQAALLALPQPNVPGNLFINTSDVLVQNYDNYSARVDYAQSASMKFFARYSGSTENASIPGSLPGRPTLDNAIPRNVAVGLTQVISSSMVNDIRVGFNRLNFLYGLPEPAFNISGQNQTLPNFISGQLNFGGAGPYNATGPGGIASARNNTYQAWDVLAWHLGRHSLRLGGEFDAFQYVRFEDADALGSLTFTSGYTNATGAAPKATDHSGDAIATALLGLPQTATRTLGPNRIDGRQYNYAAFVQDDMRISLTVTANFGVRYEVSPPMHDIRNQMSSIDFTTAPSPQTIFAAGTQGVYSPLLFVCGKSGHPAGCAYTNWTNYSPRAGLVWSANPKTVIRAGGGLYYGTQDGNTLLKLAQSLPTTYAQTLTFNAFVPQNPNLNVFTAAIVGSQAISAASIDAHQKNPYSPQWSLNIQREIAKQTVVEVGYLGSLGVHLEQNVQPNNGLPGTAVKRPYFGLTLSPDVQSALNFPMTSSVVPVSQVNYFPHSAQSNYHALDLRLEKRYQDGLSLLTSFTWSKALSNASQYRNAGGITGSENSPPQNSFNLAAERSPAYYNAKLRSVTSVVYDLPFGAGHHLMAQGVPGIVFGGWQISTIVQMQSGYPYTINYKGDPVNIGGGSGGVLIRPNQAVDAGGNPINADLPADQRTTARFFNTSAFVQPNASFGTIGRNSMMGSQMANVDATIARTFRIAERMAAQFRAEFFNVANHANYNLIGRIVNDPTFGIVQNGLPPRQIQFALKLSF
jgi:Carboxypeptidase regulatory-like domain/TonB-dependent Receptor Plug Domain/TonB dependent receptor